MNKKYVWLIDIRNCPFCKGKAHVSVRQTAFLGYAEWPGNKKIKYAAQVICNKCKARGPVVTDTLITGLGFWEQLGELQSEAINEWNRRVSEG